MFLKKRGPQILQKGGPLSEIAWDKDTVQWIAKGDRLDVKITHINMTTSLGSRSDARSEDRTECEMHGVMTYPKFIPVTINVMKDEKQFGGFFYNRSDKNNFTDEHKINLPLLEVWLSDRDEQKTLLLTGALRDVILSGRKHAGVRFFKKKGEGLMTELEKKEGWSYQSRYSILGLAIWQELHASTLPRWTLPTNYNDFSLDDLPRWRSDLDSKLE